jgi:rhodanese-related sulfurtransferase
VLSYEDQSERFLKTVPSHAVLNAFLKDRHYNHSPQFHPIEGLDGQYRTGSGSDRMLTLNDSGGRNSISKLECLDPVATAHGSVTGAALLMGAANHMKHSEGFLKLVNDAKARIREVTVAETRERMKANAAVRLLDVREDNEWQLGRAAGSSHLGKGIIERDIEVQVPDKTTEVILYCGGGFRSALAADVLQQMGYTNVYSMAGGWKAWKDAGAPIESD